MNSYGLLIAMGICWGCQQTPHYTLQGNMGDFSGNIFLVTNDEQGIPDTLGVAEADKGVFQFQGDIDSPIYAWLQMEGKNTHIPLLLENADFKVSLEAGKYKVEGGTLQSYRNEFRKIERMIALQRDSLKNEYRKYSATDNVFGGLHIRALMMDLDSLYEERENQFIASHNNLAGAAIIREQLFELIHRRSLGQKIELLGDSARQTVLGKELAYYLEHNHLAEVGMAAPDFTSITPEGTSVSLYGVRAKVKIVDFWASWCGPCRAENPHVRRIYEKYHDKGLEIISVSLDSKKEAWVKAIEKDALPWIQVSDLNGWNNSVAKLYGVRGIPHAFVLDEHNRIIGQKLYGRELEECVANALR